MDVEHDAVFDEGQRGGGEGEVHWVGGEVVVQVGLRAEFEDEAVRETFGVGFPGLVLAWRDGF